MGGFLLFLGTDYYLCWCSHCRGNNRCTIQRFVSTAVIFINNVAGLLSNMNGETETSMHETCWQRVLTSIKRRWNLVTAAVILDHLVRKISSALTSRGSGDRGNKDAETIDKGLTEEVEIGALIGK